MSNVPRQRPRSSKSSPARGRGATPSSRPVSASKAKAAANYDNLPLRSWEDVRNALTNGSLQPGQVLYMKYLLFDPMDTNIKKESRAHSKSQKSRSRSQKSQTGLRSESSSAMPNTSSMKTSDDTSKTEPARLPARPSESTDGKPTEVGGEQSSAPQPTSTTVTPPQSQAPPRPRSYASAVTTSPNVPASQPKRTPGIPGAAVSHPPSQVRQVSHTVGRGAAAQVGSSSSSAGALMAPRGVSTRGRSSQSTGRTYEGREPTPPKATKNNSAFEKTTAAQIPVKYDMLNQDSLLSPSPTQSSKAMESAAGEIPHHGIILPGSNSDSILLAPTTTFGSSKMLNPPEEGKKVIRDGSRQYYAAVNASMKEEGMLYGPIKMMSGPMHLIKWVYLRQATKIVFDKVVGLDPKIAWVRGPTEERYDIETVEQIKAWISSFGPLDPDEREKQPEGAASGEGTEATTSVSGQQSVAVA